MPDSLSLWLEAEGWDRKSQGGMVSISCIPALKRIFGYHATISSERFVIYTAAL
jgi:hypothetical protein